MSNMVGVFRDRTTWAICALNQGGGIVVEKRARSVSLAAPRFVVSQQGRQEYLRGKYVPSHALIVGDLVEGRPDVDLELLAYDPKTMQGYQIADEEWPVPAAAFALCDDYGRVWAA